MILAAGNSLAAANAAGKIDIPFQKFVLDNGLTLIVHEDHKAPIVAFNVWYHVGSKNEKPGRTGFAHLFEHLMFNGSENYNDDYFKPMQKIGATDLNGTTNEDRTNYFENVPTPAFDLALWMESDRMGHLQGADQPGQARRAARRGAEREAPVRQRALQRRRGAHRQGLLPGRPSLLLDGDRFHGGPAGGHAGGRAPVVLHLLRPEQRRDRHRRRHRRRRRRWPRSSNFSATSLRARPSPATRPGSPSAAASSARSSRTASPRPGS